MDPSTTKPGSGLSDQPAGLALSAFQVSGGRVLDDPAEDRLAVLHAELHQAGAEHRLLAVQQDWFEAQGQGAPRYFQDGHALGNPLVALALEAMAVALQPLRNSHCAELNAPAQGRFRSPPNWSRSLF